MMFFQGHLGCILKLFMETLRRNQSRDFGGLPREGRQSHTARWDVRDQRPVLFLSLSLLMSHVQLWGDELEGSCSGTAPLGIATAPQSTPRALLDP